MQNTYYIEVTDTFSGEANYSWITRHAIVSRIVFINPSTNKTEESGLYSISEMNNIITCWKLGELLGSFAIGCILTDNAQIELM